MAGLISGAMITGGAVVVAPDASADPRITGTYSSLPNDKYAEALRFNTEKISMLTNQGEYKKMLETWMQVTPLGPGWCIDLEKPQPNLQTQGYELRKLDGMSGLYGFNGFNGSLGINADIETASISLTKSMLKSWYEGNLGDVKKKNVALQALLSNNKSVLDGQRSYILNGQAQNGVRVTNQEFTQWTGFRVSAVFGGNDSFQPNFALVKDQAAFSRVSSNVRPGEYVTILLPKDYNIYQDGREATFQRLIPPTQPGLDGFYPRPGGGNGGGTVTTTVTVTEGPGSTSTVTETGQPTVTKTVYKHEGLDYETITERPEVTVTREFQEIYKTEKTEVPDPVTVTETAPRPVVTVPVFEDGEATIVTETVTAPRDVIVVEKKTPVTVTETSTVRPTITETNKVRPTVTVTEPTYVTATKTLDPKTETKTVQADPSTVTKVVDTTVTRVSESRKTTTVERHFYKYNYVYDFSNKSESKVIEPNKSGNWKIEFVDDSQGLVEVTKEGNRLVVTPKKQGEGDVRIVITDGDGNRYEYTIHVVNKDSQKTTEKTVRVNNHFFNVAVTGLDQSIKLPKGWKYEVTEGKDLVKTTEDGDTLNVNVNDGVITGKVKVKVFEVDKNGQPTGNEENYEFNVDTNPNKYNQTRVIGNVSSYKIEVDNIVGEPEVLQGDDIIESLEKKGDQWVLTPKAGKTGKVVVRAKNDKGETFVFTLDVRDGRNVLVDSQTKIISVGEGADIEGQPGDKIEIVRGKELVPPEQLEGDGKWNLKPTDDGLIVAHVKDSNGQLVGVFTIVVTPAEAKPAKQTVPTTVSNRRTLILTKGLASNEFTFPEGTDNFSWVKDENDPNKFYLMPNPNFVGEIRVVEKTQGGHELIEHIITVTESKVDEVKQDLPAGSKMTLPSVKDNQKFVVVAGAELLNGKVNPQGGQDLTLKKGVSGKVVIEIQNSRDLPIKRFVYNVTPNEANTTSFEITSDDKFTTNVNPGDTVKIVEGGDLADLSNNGNEWVVTPNDGAEGKVVVEVTDESGSVYQKFILNITKGKGGSGSNDNFERSYTITEKGTFDVTIVNNHKYEIVEGQNNVEIVQDTEGRYILRMKEGSKGGKVVVVEKDSNGNVVKKHNITIIEDHGALNFVEERRVYQPKLTDKIIPGKGENKFRVLRGEDIIEDIPTTPGTFTLKPRPGKSGRVQIEEVDHEGNPVRILDIDVPATSEGNIIVKPGNSDVSPNPDGSWRIVIPDGGKISDIKVCEGPNNCKPVDPKMIEKNPDGSITIKPGEGGITPNTTHIYFTPWINGQKQDEVQVNVVIKDKVATSSDGKCIASLVGIASPLLLLIPLGILSQVRIPGLEGIHGKLNAAVREANDRIQRGMGIYDRDRAERAAGLQGAFSAVNPELLGLAGGALGTITAGLLIVDAVLRSCGQGDKTSSYQIGKATGNDTLVYGSSKKGDVVRTVTPVPATETTTPAAPEN
ncbi:hypothetical protein BJP08_02065 [Corynebacterium sp. NML140438]|uniref:hypothetical protein n=1 Tax=Corynebacterium sp. NML140438 TaxID=1906334 RepID=UPI0008FAEE57|nr:hypothetical protein [Corynebacterium sp. NML140438]OIR44179.1 hypothetical protein BJP08_02065 [Corynebacterium sp. NML140438]